MAADREVVTRGFGTGSVAFQGTIPLVALRGYVTADYKRYLIDLESMAWYQYHIQKVH